MWATDLEQPCEENICIEYMDKQILERLWRREKF